MDVCANLEGVGITPGLRRSELQSLCENSNIFVGLGFSHDIKPAISVSALAPEDLKRSCHTDSSAPTFKVMELGASAPEAPGLNSPFQPTLCVGPQGPTSDIAIRRPLSYRLFELGKYLRGIALDRREGLPYGLRKSAPKPYIPAE